MAETIEEVRQRVRQAQVNYFDNLRYLENLLVQERGYVSKIPQNQDVVVLMSGGLDSSIMVAKIIEDWNCKVHPLFLKRGARNEKYEEEALDFFAGVYLQKFPDNFSEPVKLTYEIPPKIFKVGFPQSFSKTVGIPMRNSTMQNLAVMYAVSLQNRGIEAKTIFSGSIYDDNTEPELGLLSLRSQTLSTCVQMADWQWNITSPLTDPYLVDSPLSKADLINYAVKKFLPVDKTRTCFSSDSEACGVCHACKKRLQAFEETGFADIIKYREKGEL
jgi:7-cyano-7-deazaguanine synthase